MIKKTQFKSGNLLVSALLALIIASIMIAGAYKYFGQGQNMNNSTNLLTELKTSEAQAVAYHNNGNTNITLATYLPKLKKMNVAGKTLSAVVVNDDYSVLNNFIGNGSIYLSGFDDVQNALVNGIVLNLATDNDITNNAGGQTGIGDEQYAENFAFQGNDTLANAGLDWKYAVLLTKNIDIGNTFKQLAQDAPSVYTYYEGLTIGSGATDTNGYALMINK